MDKTKPLLKVTKLPSSKSQPGASQPFVQGDRVLMSMRGLPGTLMAAEKSPASWATLLEDLGAVGTCSAFLFTQKPERSLDMG